MHLVPHHERVGDGREGRRDLAWRDLEVFEGELRAHQELTELAVGVMVGIQDVAAEIMDEPGDARHDALPVLAMNQQHDRLGVVRHPGHRRAGLTDLGMVVSSGCQCERKTRARLLSPRKGVNRKDLKRCVVSQAAARAPLRAATTQYSCLTPILFRPVTYFSAFSARSFSISWRKRVTGWAPLIETPSMVS